MRVTSEFWVSAVTRRVFNAGGYAAVVRRGATEAGAIFVMVRSRDGTCSLYGPASQTSYEEAGPQERRFTAVAEGDDAAIAARIEKESRFDPDLWLLEIEADSKLVEEIVPLTTP